MTQYLNLVMKTGQACYNLKRDNENEQQSLQCELNFFVGRLLYVLRE